MATRAVVFLRANPIDPDPRVEKQAKTLALAGFKVLAVGWDRTGQLPSPVPMAHFTIHRLGPKALFGTGLRNLSKLMIWQWFLFRWLWQNRHTFTHIHAADLDTALPALAMKYLTGKYFVYDIYDFFSASRKGPRLLKRVAEWIEIRVINRADAVIIVDESRKVQLGNAKPKHLELIYNSPERTEVQPATNSMDKPHKLTIVFVGFLQDHRWLFEMVDLLKEHRDWFLDLGGFGDIAAELEKRVASLPNIKFHGRVPYEQTLSLAANADVLFAIYDPVLEGHRFSSANKLFEAMMLGKPILVARNTGMDQLVERYNLGFVIDYHTKEDVENALETIVSWSEEERLEFSKRVRQIYQQHFSWETMAERLRGIYTRLGARPA